jgi:Family of unknown function (DUF5995)
MAAKHRAVRAARTGWLAPGEDLDECHGGEHSGAGGRGLCSIQYVVVGPIRSSNCRAIMPSTVRSRLSVARLAALLVLAAVLACVTVAPAVAGPQSPAGGVIATGGKKGQLPDGYRPKQFCPQQRDQCLRRLLRKMESNYERLGCKHASIFSLLYWRTTEGIRDANWSGQFSDRRVWNQLTYAFGMYYLDAFKTWRTGKTSRTPKAWRIAFKAARDEEVSSAGDIWLGINAHVNRDLAFVYYQLGLDNHADHLHVNTVLARARLVVFPEIVATLDPSVAGQMPNDPTLSLDVFAWREVAWDNAQRLAAAPNAKARGRIAAKIERNAVATANRIKAAFPATAEANQARDAFCAAHRPG